MALIYMALIIFSSYHMALIYMALYNMALLFIQFVIYIGVPKLYFIKNFEILIKAKHKEVSKESVCLDLGIPNRVMTRPF